MSEESKEERKVTWGVPEYIVDEDFPPLPEEVAQALEIEREETPTIPLSKAKACIRGLIRRKNVMIVLNFFFVRNNAYSSAEVMRALRNYMSDSTVAFAIKKLSDVGLLQATKIPSLDKKTVYFQLINKNIAGFAVKEWKQTLSYILARYIPYQRTTIKQVKEDSRFIEKAHYFGLTIDEAIDILKKCPHLKVEYDRGLTFLERITQGYIPEQEKPKKEVKEFEPEAVEVE